MPNPQVVLVGTGFGGIGLLHELYDKHQPTDEKALPFDLTVVDRNSHLSIGAAWQYVWTDRILDVPQWPLQSLKVLDRSVVQNVRVGQGDSSTVEAISVKDKNLTFKDGTVLKYDTLVLSPGVVSDASLIEGLDQSHAIDICDMKAVSVMKERVHQLCQAASTEPQTVMVCVTKMPYKCPPVPFEYASLLDDVFRQHGSRDNTHIILAVPVPFPFAGPPAAKLFCGLLKEMDIEYWPEHVLTRVETSVGDTKSLVHFSLPNGESKSIAVDGLFCTFPQRAPDFLAPLCNAGGYIPVDLQTNRYGKDDIFVIGDACHVMFPKPDKPHPKAGEFAWQMGQHVADQLMAKYSTNGGKNKKIPPPAREALCVAECGVSGQGVNVQPNFTEILRNPANGMPVFDLEIVDGASQRKLDWINQYLNCMLNNTELQVPEDAVMKSLQLVFSGLVLMNL